MIEYVIILILRYLVPRLHLPDDGWSFVWLGLVLSYYDKRHQLNQHRDYPFSLSSLDGEWVQHFGWYL